MALRVNNNIAALNARRNLNINTRELNVKLGRLSSGLRINRAADDAAGLSIREGMRSEIASLRVNVLNAEQASNLVQVAEGSLNEVNSILIRMRELATQSASSTVTDENRESIQAEFSQMTAEIDRIAQSTTYNNQTLLTGYGNTVSADSTAVAASDTTGVTNVKISGAASGTYTFEDTANDNEITLGNGVVSQTIRVGTLLDDGVVATGTQVVANFDRLGIQLTLAGAGVDGAAGQYADGDLDGREIVIEAGTGGSFQVGPSNQAFNRMEMNIVDMQATGVNLNLGSSSVVSITTAREAMTAIDRAISVVGQQRGDLGAFQNRLSFAIAYTENSIENNQASEAAISDADIAAEVAGFTRAQILSQAATAMLAQANAQPQNALALLQ